MLSFTYKLNFLQNICKICMQQVWGKFASVSGKLYLNDNPFSRWTDNDLSMGTTHTGIFSANDVCINSTTFVFGIRLKNMSYTWKMKKSSNYNKKVTLVTEYKLFILLIPSKKIYILCTIICSSECKKKFLYNLQFVRSL